MHDLMGWWEFTFVPSRLGLRSFPSVLNQFPSSVPVLVRGPRKSNACLYLCPAFLKPGCVPVVELNMSISLVWSVHYDEIMLKSFRRFLLMIYTPKSPGCLGYDKKTNRRFVVTSFCSTMATTQHLRAVIHAPSWSYFPSEDHQKMEILCFLSSDAG